MKRYGYAAVAAAALLTVSSLGMQANAESSTAIEISASVADACEFTANTVDLSFNEYTPGQATDLAAQGSVEVNCTVAATNVTFSAGNGNNGRNAGGNREMDNGGSGRLEYQLISEAGLFGDGGFDTPLVKDLVQNLNTIVIDGIVPGSQNPQGGNYTDSVLITMSF
ncbi:MAG: spore coat protein U domain-containing protein [Alphaproteobacteria bacterium]